MADSWEDALFNDEPLFPARRDAWNEVAALGTGMTAEQRLREQQAMLSQHVLQEEHRNDNARLAPAPVRNPAQQPAPVAQVQRLGHVSTSEESGDEEHAVHQPINLRGDSGWNERQRDRRRSSRGDKSPKKKTSRSQSKQSDSPNSGNALGGGGGSSRDVVDAQDSATDVTSLVGERKDGYERLTPHGSGVSGGISLLGTTATHARMCLSSAVVALAFYAHTLGLVPALLGQGVSLLLLMRCTHCAHFARAYLRERSASMGYKRPPAFTLSDTCASAWGAWAGVLADALEFVLLVCLCCATVVLGGEGLLWFFPAMSTLGRSALASQVACFFAFYPRLRYVSHLEFWCQVIFSFGILSLLAGRRGSPGVTISPLTNASQPVNATTGVGGGEGTHSVNLPVFGKSGPDLLHAASLYVCVCAASLRGTWAAILPLRDGEGSDGALGARTGRKALTVSLAWQSAFALIGASSLSFSFTQCPRPPPYSRAAEQGMFLLALSQIANFGSQLTPARALLERNVLGRTFVPRAGGLGFVRGLLRGIFRASFVFMIVLAAATLPRFGSWVALAGALGGVPCAFVLPSALSLSCKSSVCTKLLDLITLGCGCIISLAGFLPVYKDLNEHHDWGVAKLGWA